MEDLLSGRPRKRPDSPTADKACGSRANRASVRRRRIKAVIPQRRDQVANRLRKGSAGGWPPSFDPDACKRRNQVERGFTRRKQFRALATHYDKLALHWQAHQRHRRDHRLDPSCPRQNPIMTRWTRPGGSAA